MSGVKVHILREGKVRIEWDGFQGEACFLEADKLYKLLKAKGVDVEIREVKRKMEFAKESKVAVATKSKEMEWSL